MAISKINVGGTEHTLEATKLVDTRYIDGVSFTGESNVTRYATCNTAAGDKAKTASITSGTFSLITGARVTVKFKYANSVSTPTLNVDGTGAKAIYWHGNVLVTSQYWQAGSVLDFVYDGTQWELVGIAKDNNTTYTSLKNPYSLTIQGNGTTLTDGTYDGSAAKTVNITPSSIGAAASSHTHREYASLVPYGTAIPANADLNTITYLKVGNYYCSKNVDAATLTNCPTTSAFMMQVISPLATTMDNESTGTWVYRLRKLQVYTGEEYIQYCYSSGTAGSWTYGEWKKSIKSDNTATTTAHGLLSADDKTKLDGIATGANKYIHPTTDGNKHIPSGGSSGQFLKYSTSGTATWSALPAASGTEAGITIVYPAASCTTFTSDTGTCTPAAVKKAVGMFDPKAHNHSASDITSGTLPIARGGTGATTASDALNNLGAVGRIDTANSSTNGGTGEIFNNYSGDYKNIASGEYSHAEGFKTTASGDESHSEGYGTKASGLYSHAEGEETTAGIRCSHTEGKNTKTIITGLLQYGAHAEGWNSIAVHSGAHAEGLGSVAADYGSHAENSSFSGGEYAHSEGDSGGVMRQVTLTHISGNEYSISGISFSDVRQGHYIFQSGQVDSAENNSRVHEIVKKNSNTIELSHPLSTSSHYIFYTTSGALGESSHSEGYGCTTLGSYAHAEGNGSVASGGGSHAEGCDTKASGAYSHAEGYIYLDTSDYMIYQTEATGMGSHAEGGGTLAEGDCSHSEGIMTLASNIASHAEGYFTVASGDYSHAEGQSTTASGVVSHAEGKSTKASGVNSHAEGIGTQAVTDYTHAEGYVTIANNFASHAQGKFNKTMNAGGALNNTNGDAMVIGNGTSQSAASNAFRVSYAGQALCKAGYGSSGADYAEYFEWEDGNENAEDRVGCFVTMNGNKICKANSNDYILGVVSGNPCVIGNADEDWLGRWEYDEFGRFIKEDVDSPVTEWKKVEVDILDKDGNPTGETKTELKEVETGEVIHGWRYKANPDYDSTQEYIERKDRKEWDAVGMLGVLSVRDDGTCEVNGYAKVAQGGTATKAESYIHGITYRVIKRMSDNVVQIVFR